MEGLVNQEKNGEKTLKTRFMGKLFKEKKAPTEQDDQDVSSFLHGPSDKLYMMPPSDNASHAPPLTRIDTNAASRWPAAREINNHKNIDRTRSASPRRSRKGLVVRFTEHAPEVIGEGGDEATSPVAEIGARKRAYSHPPLANLNQTPGRREDLVPVQHAQTKPAALDEELRSAAPSHRMHTGLPYPDDDLRSTAQGSNNPTGNGFGVSNADHSVLSTSDGGVFASNIRAQMRADEGRALKQAASEASHLDQQVPYPESNLSTEAEAETTSKMNRLQLHAMNNSETSLSTGVAASPSQPAVSLDNTSPSSTKSIPYPQPSVRQSPVIHRPQIPSQLAPGLAGSRPPLAPSGNSQYLNQGSVPASRSTSFTMQDAVVAAGDDALQDFSRRCAHLFTLFRLAAESVNPIPKCTSQELVRAALWWFVKGRSNLEASIRQRPTNPDSPHQNLMGRQQAHADLGKAVWLNEILTARFSSQNASDAASSPAELVACQQNMIVSLRKLAISMKRNNLLPPDADDAPLPQGLDNTIWVADDGDRTLLASQRLNSAFNLSELFSLSDSTEYFHYGRLFAEAVLLEESASQYYRCHVLLSILRGQTVKDLTVTIASQDGSFNLGIQNDKSRGPVWDEVSWDSSTNTLQMKLPRGFTLQIHCSKDDFQAMWGLYDMHKEIYAVLDQRSGEKLVFETTVRTFQQFELESNRLPKDALPQCHMKVYEKLLVEKAATGTRTRHLGFRLALCSNPKTKNLKGVDRTLSPSNPILFGFLRGEGGLPALLLKSSDEKSEHNVVLTFDDLSQRANLHALLTGLALQGTEEVVAEGQMSSFAVTKDKNYDAKSLKYLDWQSFRIINESNGDAQKYKTVLSDHLRIVLDFKAGTLTDRVNLEPGELKIRLDAKSLNEIKIFRQAQQDITISASESQVLKDVPAELSDLLRIMGRYETTRAYNFPSMKQLHLFQSALTGVNVLFDGVAASFNISRRRMVVPIYKKWEAATTRIQLVQKDTVVQLVAFFDNFSHGECMNFTLKSTDNFESTGRSSKFSIRIVDAKFALPKASAEADSGNDAGFVCLDMPEYPGEHDDITIVFSTEEDRDKFAQGLPSPLKQASRMASIRR